MRSCGWILPISMAESRAHSSESSDSLVIEYLPLEKAKSPVWDFFGFPAHDGKFLETNKMKRQSVHCKLCKRAEATLQICWSTSSIITNWSTVKLHWKWPLMVDESLENGKQGNAQSLRLLSSSLIPRSSSRWKLLTDSVCYCIAKDMLPFVCVNDPGFRQMLHTFEPRYVPPDRTTIPRYYMPELYDQEKTRIMKAIATELQYFAFTSDGWSSRANHSYISLTVHYIDSQWVIRCHSWRLLNAQLTTLLTI